MESRNANTPLILLGIDKQFLAKGKKKFEELFSAMTEDCVKNGEEGDLNKTFFLTLASVEKNMHSGDKGLSQ